LQRRATRVIDRAIDDTEGLEQHAVANAKPRPTAAV
jgi:hypothetical protein